MTWIWRLTVSKVWLSDCLMFLAQNIHKSISYFAIHIFCLLSSKQVCASFETLWDVYLFFISVYISDLYIHTEIGLLLERRLSFSDTNVQVDSPCPLNQYALKQGFIKIHFIFKFCYSSDFKIPTNSSPYPTITVLILQ